MPTVLDILKKSTDYLAQRGSPTSRLDAEVLLAAALGKSRVALYLAFETVLSEDELSRSRAAIRRRAAGEPVAYITGEKEFYSRRFKVGPGVLVPRPETEHLIDALVSHYRLTPPHPGLRILDLGTGSGVLAVTAALAFPHSTVTALELSPDALVWAQENTRLHGCETRITCRQGDMSQPEVLASLGQYDVVLANPPYLTEADFTAASRELTEFEPKLALVAAEAGCFFYRVLFDALPGLLAPGGVFIAEMGAQQRALIEALFAERLLAPGYQLRVYKDYAGWDRGFVIDTPNP